MRLRNAVDGFLDIFQRVPHHALLPRLFSLLGLSLLLLLLSTFQPLQPQNFALHLLGFLKSLPRARLQLAGDAVEAGWALEPVRRGRLDGVGAARDELRRREARNEGVGVREREGPP